MRQSSVANHCQKSPVNVVAQKTPDPGRPGQQSSTLQKIQQIPDLLLPDDGKNVRDAQGDGRGADYAAHGVADSWKDQPYHSSHESLLTHGS